MNSLRMAGTSQAATLATAVIVAICILPSLAAAQLAVSTGGITFANQPVNTTSTAQTIVVTNNGDLTSIGGVYLSGADAFSYLPTSGCTGQQLAPGESCSIGIQFSPVHAGLAQATLSIGDPLGVPISSVLVSGNATGATPTYVVPTYDVSVIDAPANIWAIQINGVLNNHDEFTGMLYYKDSCGELELGWGDWGTAFLYSGGKYIDLSMVPGSIIGAPNLAYGPGYSCAEWSWGMGVDDASEVFGVAVAAPQDQAFPWVYASGTVTTVQQAVTDGSTVSGLVAHVFPNGVVLFDNGQYSGLTGWSGNGQSAFGNYFLNGHVKPLPPVPSGPCFAFFDASNLNWLPDCGFPGFPGGFVDQQGLDAGWSNNTGAAALLQHGVVVDTGVAGVMFDSVNAAGQAVGTVYGDSYGAVYWDRSTGIHDLNTLLPPGWSYVPAGGGGNTEGYPNSINDAGHILAQAVDPANVAHLVILVPRATMPTGSNVVVHSGSTSLTFGTVTTSGTTTVSPIDASTTGTVPGGFAISNTVAYQITTTASFSGAVTIGFVVPGPISQADFNNLRVLHNQNGSLVDITTGYDYSRLTIYGTTTSFSPFYLGRIGTHIAPLFDTSKAHKAGSTIPVKLQVLNAANANLSSQTLPVKARKVLRLQDSTNTNVIDSGNSNPDSDFRFDPTIGGTGGYIFNLSTKNLSSGTYSLSMYVGTDKQFVYSVSFEVR